MTTPTVEAHDEMTELEEARLEITTIAGDRDLRYAEYGDPNGSPVVFLHGTPGSSRLAALFDSAAEQSGVRLLAPDRPGFGQSSPWPERAVQDAPRFVTPVLDDAGVDTAGLVAFSGGSPYALATAATVPDRITRVDVVAGATPPTTDDETPAVQRLLTGLATTTPTILRGLFRGQAWLADRLDPSFVTAQYTTGGNDGSITHETGAIVKRDFVEAFAQSRQGAVTEFCHTASDWEIDYADIDAEVTFWHGENDTNVPIGGVRRLATAIPTAELHAIEDADHLGTLLECTPEVLNTY